MTNMQVVKTPPTNLYVSSHKRKEMQHKIQSQANAIGMKGSANFTLGSKIVKAALVRVKTMKDEEELEAAKDPAHRELEEIGNMDTIDGYFHFVGS